MPQIPLDTDPGRTPFAAGDIRAEANPALFGAKGAALAEGGQQISAEAQQFAGQYGEAVRQKQASDLIFSGMQQLAQSSEKWARVPDSHQAIAGFGQDAQRIRDQLAGQTSDPLVQGMVLRELNGHQFWASREVQSRSFNLEANTHVAGLDDQLFGQNGYQQMAAAATDPMTRASIVDKATAAVKGSVAAGWMYPEAGEQRLLRFRNQVWGNAVEQGLRTDPKTTLAALDAGEYNNRLSPELRERLEPAIERARGLGIANQYPFAHLGLGAGTAGAGGAGAHNPGNIKLPSGGFASYSSDEEGVAAISHNLDAYADQHSVNTLAGVISRWAPPSGNDTARLIQNAAERTGYAPDATIDLHDPAVKENLIGAIVAQEGRGKIDPALIHRVALGQSTATGAPIASSSTPASTAAATSAPDIETAVADIGRRVEAGEIGERAGDVAIAELNRRYSIWKSETEGARYALDQRLKDGIASLALGRDWDPPAADIRRLLPADRADEVMQQIGEAREAGQAKNAVAFADPQQLQAIQQQAPARINSGVDVARNLRYTDQLRRAIAARNQALTGDPAAYVAQAPTVAAALKAIDPNNPGPGILAATQASLAEQARLGIEDHDQRVLSNDSAARLAQKIAGQDPAQINMAAEIDNLAKEYGRYWPKVFGELVTQGKLPADYQVLGTMDRPEQGIAAGDFQTMLQTIGEKGGAEKLKQAVAPEAVKAIDQGLPGIMGDFRATLPHDPALYQMMSTAVQNLARYYAYRGDDPGPALRKAYDGIIGLHWEFDGALRAPRGQLDTIERAARAVQNGVRLDQLGPVPGNPLLTLDQRQGVYRGAMRNGFWATNEGDDGAVLMLRYPNGAIDQARMADGKRVEFKFSDAQHLAGPPPQLPPPEPGIVP